MLDMLGRVSGGALDGPVPSLFCAAGRVALSLAASASAFAAAREPRVIREGELRYTVS